MTTPIRTILLHGLHMNTWQLRTLAKQVQTSGFDTHCFGYFSVLQTISQHSHRLHQWLDKHHEPDAPLHLVGHSLGGLVIRDFLANYPKWQVKRCVTLGTPHQGSICASYAKRYARPLVHQAMPNALDGNCPLPPPHIEFGVIAGNKPIGLGLPILSLHNRKHKLNAQHDGTVFVSESTLINAQDYLLLPVSHTGLLFDRQVARQTVHFLQHGKFDHTPDE